MQNIASLISTVAGAFCVSAIVDSYTRSDVEKKELVQGKSRTSGDGGRDEWEGTGRNQVYIGGKAEFVECGEIVG